MSDRVIQVTLMVSSNSSVCPAAMTILERMIECYDDMLSQPETIEIIGLIEMETP